MAADAFDPSQSAPNTAPAGPVIGGVDVRDVSGCIGLQLRRTGRMTTQMFEAHLQPAGLTVGQFGVMAQLYGGSLWRGPMSMKELANMLGMDPTTLNRTLKPLEAQGFVITAPDSNDRRARCIELTTSGRQRLAQAMPLWRAADDELRRTVGAEAAVALSGLLGLASEKLRKPG
jgi:DNA-binding MarR family transcriptional regulator